MVHVKIICFAAMYIIFHILQNFSEIYMLRSTLSKWIIFRDAGEGFGLPQTMKLTVHSNFN